MTKLQLRYIDKWVELLKSGLIKQNQSIGLVRNNEGCLAAVLIAAIDMIHGSTLEEIQDMSNNSQGKSDQDVYLFGLSLKLESDILVNFIRNDNDAWSFNQMADYLTKTYLK